MTPIRNNRLTEKHIFNHKNCIAPSYMLVLANSTKYFALSRVVLLYPQKSVSQQQVINLIQCKLNINFYDCYSFLPFNLN